MPPPPDSNLFTQYVLESPWLLTTILLAIALALGWTGMRDGMVKRMQIALAVAAAAIAVVLLGYFITTPGEHARHVTRLMVTFAVERDASAAVKMFASDAAFAVGSPRNPGLGMDYIERQLFDLASRYTIESNQITMLKGYTQDSQTGVAHLACLTTVQNFPYPTMSQWVVRVRRQRDGQWKIDHLTCVSINDRTPTLEQLR